MPDTLESKLTVTNYWKYRTTDTGLTAPRGEEPTQKYEATYTKGPDDNQLQELFRDRRTVTTATTTDDIDVVGVLSNIFGETISFVKLRELWVYNLETTSGEIISVGGAGTNPITSFFANSGAPSTAAVDVLPGGLLVLSGPVDGYSVTGGSADTLRVTHEGSAGDILYEIILKGTLE